MPAAPDLVRRRFTASAPNELWIADITYVPTWEGWLFLAVVMDACSRRVCGWSMRDDLKADLVVDALGMATTRRRPGPGLIHHSDRGGQYRSLAFGRTLVIRASLRRWVHGAMPSTMPPRELHGQHQDRTHEEADIQDERRSQARGLLLHRGLLQPPAQAFSPRLSISDRIREDAQGELCRDCSGLTENSQRKRGNSKRRTRVVRIFPNQ